MSYSPPPAYQPPQQQPGATGGEPPLWAPWYGIGFADAIKRPFKKYVDFTGRASRGEYWWWALAYGILSVILNVLNSAVGQGHVTFFAILAYIIGLGILLPNLGLLWRRLHDTNRSGLFALLGLIPIVGWIIVLVFTVQQSNPAGQRFDVPR